MRACCTAHDVVYKLCSLETMYAKARGRPPRDHESGAPDQAVAAGETHMNSRPGERLAAGPRRRVTAAFRWVIGGIVRAPKLHR
jgi:hypothetical protein